MSTPSVRAQPAVRIVAAFPSVRRARQAVEALRSRGLAASATTFPVAEAGLADAGIGVVQISGPAWIGLLLGAIAGLALGLLLWNGQLVLAPLAPALAAGRAAVPFLGAGVLGAAGWLAGALLALLRPSPSLAVVVALPGDPAETLARGRELIALGAREIRIVSLDRRDMLIPTEQEHQSGGGTAG